MGTGRVCGRRLAPVGRAHRRAGGGEPAPRRGRHDMLIFIGMALVNNPQNRAPVQRQRTAPIVQTGVDPRSIETLDLMTMYKLRKGFFDDYWPIVIAAKKWIQTTYSDRKMDSRVLERAKIGGPTSKDWPDAAGRISSLATEYFSQHFPYNLNIKICHQLIINEIIGMGILQPIWNDPRVNEIWVNGPDEVQVEINGIKHQIRSATFRDVEHELEFCRQILNPLNRVIGPANPYEDARLADKSRVAILHQAIAPGGPLIAIRRHPRSYWTLEDLVAKGSASKEMLRDLGWWISAEMSMLICGATSTGKTSVLDGISGMFPQNSRIYSIEDTLELELNPNKPFKVPGVEVRKTQKKDDGTMERGAFSMRDHVKASLRMSPDIVVIGEVRDAAAYDLVDAANTGHQVFSTVHAHTPAGAIVRLSNLISMSGEIVGEQTFPMIASAFNIIIMLARFSDGSRRITEIDEVNPRVGAAAVGEDLTPVQTRPIWKWERTNDDDRHVEGEWHKVGEISPLLADNFSLKNHRYPSWEDLIALEGFNGSSTKIDDQKNRSERLRR